MRRNWQDEKEKVPDFDHRQITVWGFLAAEPAVKWQVVRSGDKSRPWSAEISERTKTRSTFDAVDLHRFSMYKVLTCIPE